MENEDVKITIFLKDSPKLLANATVSMETIYFGFVTIKGFQIWNSRIFNERIQEAINIRPPTIIVYGHPYQFVFFENEQKWFELESKIYDAFVKAKSKSGNGATKELDLEEVSKEIE